MLEQTFYQNKKISKQRKVFYQIRDLESLSASVLYSGDSGSSGFGSASNFGLGPGIAREISEAESIIERVRGPGAGDSTDADHINLDYWIPGKKTKSGKQKWLELANIHIPLDDK